MPRDAQLRRGCQWQRKGDEWIDRILARLDPLLETGVQCGQSCPRTQSGAAISEQRHGVDRWRVARDSAGEDRRRTLEIFVVDQRRAEIGEDQGVVRRKRQRTPEARLGAGVVAVMRLADAVVDKDAGVTFGELA